MINITDGKPDGFLGRGLGSETDAAGTQNLALTPGLRQFSPTKKALRAGGQLWISGRSNLVQTEQGLVPECPLTGDKRAHTLSASMLPDVS